jgi:SAM-dependent methyltransferase
MSWLTPSASNQLLLFVIPLVLVLLVAQLTSLYDEQTKRRLGKDWKWLEFSPDELGFNNYRILTLASMIGLFLEMMMIRWITSEIRIFAYFKNFVLVACFLGFGLGCWICKRKVNFLAFLAPVLLLTVMLSDLLGFGLQEAMRMLPSMLGSSAEVQIWGVPAIPGSWMDLVLAMAIVVPLFALIAISFVPMGQLVGYFLEKSSNGVTGYTINVLASLAGILVYTLLCFLYQPPAIWFAVAGVGLSLLTWRIPRVRWATLAVFVIMVALLSFSHRGEGRTYWSPYQRLTITPVYSDGQLVSYDLNTNDSWYQQIVNLSPEFIAAHPTSFKDSARWNPYNVPYRFYQNPPSVLVLGAGMGNDVAAALRNGAGRVVAVEIDPLILRLGRDLHFEHPYQSPRTQTVIDDARSYIQNSRDKFDVIVFSLLDSHTTTSHFTNIRIDNYVYTVEAMESAKKLLSPDGIFIVKFQVDNRWIAGRLHGILLKSFQQEPLSFNTMSKDFGTGGHFFVTGSSARLEKSLKDPDVRSFVTDNQRGMDLGTKLTTDDWPYFYQHAPGLPLSVILVSIAVVVVFGWFMRRVGESGGNFSWHFFFLGAGFMLMEVLIISKMALLFGTTWLVNSIVVAGLLVLIVAANVVYKVLPNNSSYWAYLGLFVTIAVAFAVPLEKLFFESFAIRATVSMFLLCSPVFFAGIVFITSFERAGFKGRALGANLFGALAGGLLESLSMWFGLRSLLIVAALLYVASALTIKRSKVSENAGVSAATEELFELARP